MKAYLPLIIACVFWAAFVLVTYWLWRKLSRNQKLYNSLVWLHPENGGDYELTQLTPEAGQRPRWYRYHWWQITPKPFYLWYEEPVVKDGKITFKRCPYEPSFSETMTPTECYDVVDWQDDRIFNFIPSKLETLKWGMGLGMVGMCLLAIFLLLGEVGK